MKVKLLVATNAVRDQTDCCAFLTFHEAKRLASSTVSNLLADGAMIDIAPAHDSSSKIMRDSLTRQDIEFLECCYVFPQ